VAIIPQAIFAFLAVALVCIFWKITFTDFKGGK
jgi:hypothetical protein